MSNPFLLTGLLYMTMAMLAAGLQAAHWAGWLPAVNALNWLRVHFVTIGITTQLLFGWLPELAARRSGGPGRPAGSTWAQWGLLNIGFMLVLLGMSGDAPWLAVTGATVIFAAVALLGAGVVATLRRSPLGARAGLRFYATAPFFLLTGILMAMGLLLHWPAPGGRLGTLEAHVHANVWGFLSLVVAGTLLEWVPQALGRPLPRPQCTGRTYWLLTAGAVGLVAGPWLGAHPLTLAGLAVYVAGTVLLLVNLAGLALGARVPAVWHLALAYVWMVLPVFFAPFIVLAPHLVPGARIEGAAVQGLIMGWVLQVALGGLSLKLARPGAPALTSWWTLALVNAGVAAVWVFSLLAAPWTMAAAAAGYALLLAGWAPALARLWRTVTAGPAA